MNQQGGARRAVSFAEAFRFWVKLGWISFGGPAGQIAIMHRELVERRRWLSEERFLHALNYCMLLPGPEAQQLAIYIGWLMHRTWGGVVAGAFFVIPSIFILLLLSYVYAAHGNTAFVAGLLSGFKPVVVAIVVDAVIKIGGRALKRRAHFLIAAVSFPAIYFLHVPFPLIVLLAALAGFLGARLWPSAFVAEQKKAGALKTSDDADERPPLVIDDHAPPPPHTLPSRRRALGVLAVGFALWLLPLALLVAWQGAGGLHAQEYFFFTKAALVTFGGAYAVLAYVTQAVTVAPFEWLSPVQAVDGLALAETTPGPLIMVLQFVGFMAAFRDPGGLPPMLAGTLGGLLATWVTFTPCFLWIFLGAPYIETLRGNKALSGALSAITAAVVGVILNLAIWFAVHTVFAQVRPVAWGPLAFDAPVLTSVNVWALLLSVAAVIAMFRFKVGMIPTIAACSAAGIILYLVGAISWGA